MTSSSVLQSSECQLSNAGLTTKIGRFLDDIKPSEIKVPNPEISGILEKVKFCINQIRIFESKSTKINRFSRRTETNFELVRHLRICCCSIVTIWFDQMWYTVQAKCFKSRPFNFKNFDVQKQKILNFSWIVHGGVLANRPSIWNKFTFRSFKIIEIPSIKRNNAIMCLFVAFPKLGGISEIPENFLKGNGAFQVFRRGFFKIMDIPLRKRILQNSHFVKFRKRRVISAAILLQILSRVYCLHPLQTCFGRLFYHFCLGFN